VVAIDGPSGAGKSTVAGIVARMASLQPLDTGAMYRALGLAMGREGEDPNDSEAAADRAARIVIGFQEGRVTLDGKDEEDFIRSLQVGQIASIASAHPAVRSIIVAQQQRIISTGRWIVEGRDATTVIAPEAPVKIFLTASIEERAKRRWLQLEGADDRPPLQEVVRDVVTRDHRDYTRAASPLTLAEGATIIESWDRSPDQVAEMILREVAACDAS
jgi:cytidylate kinase